MGTRGPIPERSEARRRRNKTDGPELIQAPNGTPDNLPDDLPDPDPDWHPIATDWFLSLRESGQAAFYQPSDWATARYAAELMSRGLMGEKMPNGQYVAALNSVMSSLLTTEGDRRRARMELERKAPPRPLAAVTPMDAYRDIAGG